MEVPPIGSVLVVCNLDVFFIDLPGMALDRDIEFFINLVLDTHSISIPLYRITPVELRKLKVQLHDLLNKGFIHLSTSLWG